MMKPRNFENVFPFLGTLLLITLMMRKTECHLVQRDPNGTEMSRNTEPLEEFGIDGSEMKRNVSASSCLFCEAGTTKSRKEELDGVTHPDERANGCGPGSKPILAKIANALVNENVTKCCNQHDKCFADCNRTFSDCQGEFNSCLYDVIVTNNPKEKECKWFQLICHIEYASTHAPLLMDNLSDKYGCSYYKDTQKEICTCSNPNTTA